MAKGFGKRLAEAAAYMAAGVAGGYGKGRLEVAMQEREAYQQRIREERAAVIQQEERGWREEEAQKEREHDFAKMEKGQEFYAESQDRTLQNQMTLAKMRQAGKGGGGRGGGSQGGITRTITDAEGKVWGVTKAGEKIDLGIQGKPASSGGSTGTKEPAALQTARFKAQAKYGPDATDAQVAEFLGGSSQEKSEVVKPEALARAIQTEYSERSKMTHPGYRDWRKASEDERKQIAGAAVMGNFEAAGAELPEEFASRYRQQSQAEVPQPQAIPAVPTSTQGDEPTLATPTGAGTKDSPYVVETAEEAEWVRKHAPEDAFIKDVAAGRIVQKPKAR